MGFFRIVVALFGAFVRNRTQLALENLALRQQLAVMRRNSKRPRFKDRDRLFWVWLSRFWAHWRSALLIVQPATVVGWHRQGFRLYWRWKSRSRTGRPRISTELRDLIRRMSRENPLWGTPRIQSELRLLGYIVSKSTIDRYRVRNLKPPSQTWKCFLTNHTKDIVAIDFFTVPTATFRILYCFVVLRHDRRTVAHFNVTANPTARWTAHQVVEAFPYDEAPRFLIRDRDSTYGSEFHRRIKSMGVEEVIIAPRSPWQNPYVERVIGSVRRECLDHLIVFNERHLHRVLKDYFFYYQHVRPHLSLDQNSPVEREVELPEQGKIIAIPHVGGLHHRYRRVA